MTGTAVMKDANVPVEWLPILTWPKFFYRQQLIYTMSKAWQTWFIGGNGTGKTSVVYVNNAMQMLGIHPMQVGRAPVKVRVLVPSFDYVEDVALEKMQENQRIEFPALDKEQKAWVKLLEKNDALKHFEEPVDGKNGVIEIGPMLPPGMIKAKGKYTKEHKGIELINGSSIWFVTSEQGWQAQRGGEQDILSSDEEGDERVWDELKRGLRNAKGAGKIFCGLTPPYEPGQGPTWTKEKILDASMDDPQINVIHACMADNPSITKNFIKEFSKGKTKKQIDVQIFGKYPTWGDLVHPDFKDRMWEPGKVSGHILPNDTPMPDTYDVDWVMAFDWHQSKPCAAVFGFIDKDGNLTIYDELDKEWADGKDIHELSESFFSIEGQPYHKRKFRRWQDPSAKSAYNAVKRGFNAWDAFRKNGIITSAGKNRDPEVSISIVNEYFKGNGKDHPRVFIYERCKYLRQYLGNNFYARSEDGKGKPDPKWSDYPICLRYILGETSWAHIPKHKRSKWPLQSFKKQKSTRQTYDLGRWF
uniref:Terminase n=1 Tax=viral metagenome TaxID=1070528 RepID=A0A6H2A0U8_9ZZZZ